MTVPPLLQGAQLAKGPHCCTLKLVSALAPKPCLPWADSTITEWGRTTNEDPFLGDTGVNTWQQTWVQRLIGGFGEPSINLLTSLLRIGSDSPCYLMALPDFSFLPISFHGCISLNKLLAHLILSLHLLLSAWTNTSPHMPLWIPQTAKEGRGNGPS